jgi:pyridinium-3,5-bisthiocarboxylic acid mononucleotide nickel chelatase
MRIAYLDCFSGMSGDMFLGALVDVGVSPQLFEDTVAALNIGAKLDISRVTRGGISATKVDVFVHGEKELPREVFWEQQRHTHQHAHAASGHSHAHRNEPVQLREHNYARTAQPERGKDDSGSEVHDHDHSPGRGLSQIRELIAQATISDSAKKTATSIFDVLGAAEAKIHDRKIEEIHFHEVGSVDAIVDIVCAAIGAEALGVDEIVCSPLNVGGGTVKCAHGILPIPAPATLELLKGAPLYSSDIQVELVTPTGAAIVKLLASRFAQFPEMKIDNVGYGAGSRDFPGQPNVVRLTVGEATHAPTISEELITILESNLDDLNPQLFGYVMDRVLQAGALDAYGMPVQMKKNRPGTLLTVLAKPEDAAKLTQIIFSETSTLGVRHRQERRQALVRNWVTVRTPWGEVRMKLASMNGTVTNYAPEYEDCRRIAAEHHVPLKAVMQEAVQGYLRTRED